MITRLIKEQNDSSWMRCSIRNHYVLLWTSYHFLWTIELVHTVSRSKRSSQQISEVGLSKLFFQTVWFPQNNIPFNSWYWTRYHRHPIFSCRWWQWSWLLCLNLALTHGRFQRNFLGSAFIRANGGSSLLRKFLDYQATECFTNVWPYSVKLCTLL